MVPKIGSASIELVLFRTTDFQAGYIPMRLSQVRRPTASINSIFKATFQVAGSPNTQREQYV